MIDATGSKFRRWQQELGDPLARFWRWWSGELYGLLPNGWRRRFSSQVLVVRVDNQQEEAQLVVLDGTEEVYRLPLDVAPPPALIQQLRQMAAQAGRTVLQLDPGAVLYKSIALPAVTEPRLASVLGFEMDRHTPFKAEDVYFGYRVARREPAAQRILVDLYLLPRKRLDTLLQRLKPFGVAPTAVLPVEARTAAERQTLNLLPPELRSGNTQGRQRSMRNRSIIAALLLVMLVGFPLYQRSQRLQTLEAALDQPRAEAQRAQQIRAEIEALVDGRQYLGRRKAEQLPVLFVLDELTQLLPDNTWLSRFELSGQSLRIQGESGSASSLIGILEASEMLMSVDFTSPVTINPRSRRERFSIEARLEAPASPYEEAAP